MHITSMKMPRFSSAASLLLLAAFSGVAVSAAAAQTFDLITDPPGTTATNLRGLLNDGSLLYGFSTFGPFTWTRSQGLQPLTTPSVPSGYVPYYFADHGHIVIASDGTAALRVGPSGQQSFQTPQGYTYATPRAVSDDGFVVAGFVTDNMSRPQAVRWGPDGTATLLGTTRGFGTSQANAISRDGSTIVGRSDFSNFGPEDAFVWRQSTGIQRLPTLTGSNGQSEAFAVSGNGQYIVGQANDIPVIWHNNTVTQLHEPAGVQTFPFALAVSDDGNVVGGYLGLSGNAQFAAIWTPQTQFIPLSDYLASYGVQVPTGVTLTNVTGISADGHTIFGTTNTRFGFVVTIPCPATLAMFAPLLLRRSRRRPTRAGRLDRPAVIQPR